MGRRVNIVSVSGGKDSTATILYGLERGAEMRYVTADTGHEHPDTYEYLDYLEQRLGITIQRVKADFTRKINGKREFIKKQWKIDMMAGVEGNPKHSKSTGKKVKTYIVAPYREKPRRTRLPSNPIYLETNY